MYARVPRVSRESAEECVCPRFDKYSVHYGRAYVSINADVGAAAVRICAGYSDPEELGRDARAAERFHASGHPVQILLQALEEDR